MHHFFVKADQVQEKQVEIIGSDVRHMKNVLRMKPGEKLTVSDGENNKYLCELSCFQDTKAIVVILDKLAADTELAAEVYLFQGLPKSDKMEWIVQKAVELGVHAIIPVETGRSVVKLDDKKAARKVERWNLIAESAAKQSGRSRIPKVENIVNYSQALNDAKTLDKVLIPYELAEDMAYTRAVIGEIRAGQTVGIFIGPEGGFEKEEIAAALSGGARAITLGKRILRTETAGLAVLSIIMYQLES